MGVIVEKVQASYRDKLKEGFSFYNIFYFVLFSFVGWILETLRFLSKGRLVNRGFLSGPFCIIYGFCTLIIKYINAKIKIKNKYLKAVVLWISVIISCTIVEYFASYFIELIFGIRLWNYAKFPLNLNGRIRLGMSITWGFCGLILIYVIKPFVDKIYDKFYDEKSLMRRITYIILLIMIIDFCSSCIHYLVK